MADFPSYDLLSEVDDLTMYLDGKSGSKFDLVDFDEDVELNTGTPSHGLMNDAMLAVDSSNALLGDPLLNLFDQNELLEHQSASSYIPETLMPVSLPADSPTTHRSADAEADCSTTSSSSSSDVSLCSQAAPEEGKPVVIITRGEKSSPLRIVVKTNNMVAPLTLQKPARNFVKIPKVVGPTSSVVRMQAIRSGGKLGPTAAESPSVSTSRKMVQVPPTSPTASCSEVRTPKHPFRSLRVRHSSEASSDGPSSPTSGSKRKAYELEPQPDPLMERCRQNAINAKRNREMKKQQLVSLERKVEEVTKERDQLAGENESLREAKLKLEQQVKHLSNILKNQSKLSALIGKLGPSSVVLEDVPPSGGDEDEIITGGMCLHLDGDEATIEYCSYCAKKAGKKVNLQKVK